LAETFPTLDERHFAYIAERTTPDDDFLRGLKAAAREAGVPPIAIGSAQAALVGILLRLRRARRVVEVGTLAGYSAIAMARALPPDGHVDTIEIEPRYADFAEEWIAKSDVAGRITVHRGDGRVLLPTFETGAFDAAFFDADKASYGTYVRESRRLLAPDGLLLVDNAFAFGQLFDEHPTDREAPAVIAFNEEMARIDGFRKVIVPLGDGLWVGVKT